MPDSKSTLLITCPRCGYMINGRAWRCPGCGALKVLKARRLRKPARKTAGGMLSTLRARMFGR